MTSALQQPVNFAYAKDGFRDAEHDTYKSETGLNEQVARHTCGHGGSTPIVPARERA